MRRDAEDNVTSIIVPVYNEADNIGPCLRRLWQALGNTPHEVLICYDSDVDTTLAAIRAMPDCPPTVRLVRNDLGPGVAFALRAGFESARGDVVVTTMADLSDPPETIPAMARKIRDEAVHVVSGSRYMRGGRQIGGPLLKRTMSRMAGLSLRVLAGIGTHDPTTNFRAYSAAFLRSVRVESRQGFEVALELTVKAHLMGMKVDEVPTVWTDRSAGESKFRLWRWLPHYTYWYWMGMARPILVLLKGRAAVDRKFTERYTIST